MSRKKVKENPEVIRKELENLSNFARKTAETLVNKESTLYLSIDTLSHQAKELIRLKHYPTTACLARLNTLVKQCREEELKEEVKDFTKIIAEYNRKKG